MVHEDHEDEKNPSGFFEVRSPIGDGTLFDNSQKETFIDLEVGRTTSIVA
jgi:hypothetical protein